MASGFEKLRELKDKMMAPLFEKHRHFGCEACGHTFYGYYTKEPQTVFDFAVTLEEGASVFLPPCPIESCGMGTAGIYDAQTALHHFLKRKEKERKKAERKAKKDAEPVMVSKKLTYLNKQALSDRIDHVAANPDEMTKYEIMSSYFMDKVFWKRFGAGCHTIESRHFTIKKRLWDGTYMSNSGKTRMGRFTAYFEVTNNQTGKVREVGTKSVNAALDRRTNRRNDPDRNFGLPNSRGYR